MAGVKFGNGPVGGYRMLLGAICAAILMGCHPATSVDGAASDRRQGHPSSQTVVLQDQQLRNVRIAKVQSMQFTPSVDTLGYIDFDQDRNVPLFPTVAGRIHAIKVQAGEAIQQGQTVYTVDSPDFVTAQSNLLAAAGTLQLTTAALERARKMLAVQATAQKDLEQAQADHQNAESTYRSAQGALHVFGLSDAEIARLLDRRQVSTELPVRSPLNGQVTARNAAPGTLVQPGSSTAPVTVTDTSVKWMVASPGETESARLRVGQAVLVTVQAYPERTFRGRISNIGAALDPNTHRAAVRAEVRDPDKLLRPQMMAAFRIETGAPVAELAVPADAVVRESDGTMTVFVTRDGRSFTRRTISTGAERDNMVAVQSGLEAGEQVAAQGALFLSNALALQSQ